MVAIAWNKSLVTSYGHHGVMVTDATSVWCFAPTDSSRSGVLSSGLACQGGGDDDVKFRLVSGFRV